MQLGRWEGEDEGGTEQLVPDDGGETVDQKLLLLPRDRTLLFREFVLKSFRLFPGGFLLWQLPGADQDILSGLGKLLCCSGRGTKP